MIIYYSAWIAYAYLILHMLAVGALDELSVLEQQTKEKSTRA